jgi:NADH dehydrogenase, FAD-containing subunit
MSTVESILIVGGGFAGTTLAKRLDGRLPPGCTLTLVSEESYTTFNPMLPEAVGASIFPEQGVAPIRAMLNPRHGSRFVMGTVTGADLQARTLACRTLAGPQQLHYTQLIMAFGNRARLDMIPGMAEHALPLKTMGDAMQIRNTVLRRMARIELETDPALRAALGHFVIIGGGFSGTEVAGELIDCLHSIHHYYPRALRSELRVTVLQDIDRLLPELPPALGEAALLSLRKRGVNVRLGTRAAAVLADGVALASGEVLAARSVICTIGTRPNTLVAALGLATERGRIVTAADCSIPGHAGLWALGDCALVPNDEDGSFAPPTAQFAVREALQLAANLLGQMAGRPTRAFRHKSLGTMASIGHLKGVAQVMGLSLSGFPAWLIWRAYYLSQLPTWGRKLRIFGEWSWTMFFPTDITHLRFSQSRDLDEPSRLHPAPAPPTQAATSGAGPGAAAPIAAIGSIAEQQAG